MNRRDEERAREKRALMLRAAANTSWSDFFWQLYVGMGFVLTGVFALVVAAAAVNFDRSGGPDLMAEVRSFGLAVLGVSLVLGVGFIPAIWGKSYGKKLLLFGAIPVCLVLAALSGGFLIQLARAPAATERLVAEKVMGEFPCTDRWECKTPVDIQARWWVDFLGRHPEAPESPEVARKLASGAWTLREDSGRAEMIRALVRVYRASPARYREAMETLSRQASSGGSASADIREVLQKELPAER